MILPPCEEFISYSVQLTLENKWGCKYYVHTDKLLVTVVCDKWHTHPLLKKKMKKLMRSPCYLCVYVPPMH